VIYHTGCFNLLNSCVACLIFLLLRTIYIKHVGMFPFKVQLFQGCKSETNLLTQNLSCNMLYDTKYCWWYIIKQIPSNVAVVQHVCQITLSTSLHTHRPFLYDTKYCWWHITKRFLLNTVCKCLKRCKKG
jgi:hypothetical protein